MKLKGLVKTTLIDYPNKIGCTLFLFGCNFRCGFCHNPELVLHDDSTSISQRDVLEFLEKRKQYLDGVCISGGEPLLTLEKEFVKKIKDLDYLVKIDTNGTFPEKLQEFVDEGLVDFVAMDIKGDKEQYSKIAGVEVDLDKIEKSIKIISALEEYEFRTTILRDIHNDETLKKMGEWVNNLVGKKPKKFIVQGFKNRGKVLNKIFESEKDTSEEQLENAKKIMENYFEGVEVRG